MRPVALAVLVTVATSSSGCPCSTVGCASGASWTIVLPGARTDRDVRGLLVDVCRNGACLTDAPIPGELVTVGPRDGDGPTLGAVLGTAETTLTLRWTLRDPADGDDYSVRVRRADVPILEARADDVIYTRHRPNGPYCPPECSGVVLDAMTDDGG